MAHRRLARGAAGLAAAAIALTGCTADDPAPAEPRATEVFASTLPTASAAPTRGAVTRPRTPKEVVAALTAAELAIADPATRTRALVHAARTQQLAYRELAEHPGWDHAVVFRMPRALRPVVRANVVARRDFRAMHTTLSDTLPAWRIVAPAPADELRRYYRQAERAFGIGWEHLAAINLVETGMGRIRGTSVAGAQGPMQFLPSTWARWGRGDINDPHDAIMAAARYLAHNGGADGRMPDALYRYNNSRHYVGGVTLLAEVMESFPRAYLGYYHWDVIYLTTAGDVRLPVGYEQTEPVPVKEWLRDHPQP